VHLQGVGTLPVEKIELFSAVNRGFSGMEMDSLVLFRGKEAKPLPEEPVDEPEDCGSMEHNLTTADSGSALKTVIKKKIRVPKGTPSYQAAWLVDEYSIDDEEELYLETRPARVDP
jgi:hypothetical protein